MNPYESGATTYLGISIPGALATLSSIIHLKEWHFIQSLGSIVTKLMSRIIKYRGGN